MPCGRVLASGSCRVILVRHAVAQGDGRFQGQRDVPLTPVGRQQLRRLTQKLTHHPVQAVYSSELERARMTAAAVARAFGLEVEVRPALREMHFGCWQGLSWKQVMRRYPGGARVWVAGFPRGPIPDAERFSHFKQRVTRALHEIVAANFGRCVVVVTHAGVTRVAVGRALGLPDRFLFRMAQDPCAVNVIDYFQAGALVRCVNA